MPISPTKNRISITNLAHRISRVYKAIFPDNNKSSPELSDIMSIRDSDGNPYYITLSQLNLLLTGFSQLESYTSDNLPDADPAGQLIYISDEGVMAYSNGTDWVS